MTDDSAWPVPLAPANERPLPAERTIPRRSVVVAPNLFAIPFGLAGLAGTWLAMAGEGEATPIVGEVILGLSAAVWLAMLGGYLRAALNPPSILRSHLTDPVASPFTALTLITPMLVSADGVHRFNPGVGRVLVDTFIMLLVLLGGWLTGQWILAPLAIDEIHPGYFLPTVAGGLLAARAAAVVGQPGLGFAMFGLGGICWLVLGSVMFLRLLARPLPQAPLMPTIAIEVAPAAVASLAWFALDGDRIDIIALLLGGYGLLMVVAQSRLLPIYLRLPFMPSTWSFTFSWAAVASTCVHWLGAARPATYAVWSWVVVLAITALVGGIAIRTLMALARRQLLPDTRPRV